MMSNNFNSGPLQQLAQQDIKEELKLQGDQSFQDKINQERQENLDDLEGLANETNKVAKQFRVKVHQQRADLVEINHNVEEAKENAEVAEENIKEAEQHQKATAKCIYWICGIVAILAIVIIAIIVVALGTGEENTIEIKS